MSIEVKVPKEISEYREKIILGLNFRQLICTLLAVVVGLSTYFVLLKFMSDDIAGYILMVIVFPIFAVGFYRKDGFTFEQYLWIRFRHYWSKSQRVYKTELSIESMEGVQKNAIRNATKETKERKREAERFTLTKKEEKRRRKKIRISIEAAGKEYKRAKQTTKKSVKETKTSNNCPEHNPI